MTVDVNRSPGNGELTELAAMEAAYNALYALDEAGRRRGFTWLCSALGHPELDVQPATDVLPGPH